MIGVDCGNPWEASHWPFRPREWEGDARAFQAVRIKDPNQKEQGMDMLEGCAAGLGSPGAIRGGWQVGASSVSRPRELGEGEGGAALGWVGVVVAGREWLRLRGVAVRLGRLSPTAQGGLKKGGASTGVLPGRRAQGLP